MARYLRLGMTQRFVLLVVLCGIAILVPALAYSWQAWNSARSHGLEREGLAPARALLRVVQLTQQHRGLSAVWLGGDESQAGARKARADDVGSALAAFESELGRKGVDAGSALARALARQPRRLGGAAGRGVPQGARRRGLVGAARGGDRRLPERPGPGARPLGAGLRPGGRGLLPDRGRLAGGPARDRDPGPDAGARSQPAVQPGQGHARGPRRLLDTGQHAGGAGRQRRLRPRALRPRMALPMRAWPRRCRSFRRWACVACSMRAGMWWRRLR
jgi:hypothetical protein